MAIQQQVPLQLQLLSDGSSLVFAYGIAQLFSVNPYGDLFFNTSTLPSGVYYTSDPSIPSGSTVTFDGLGNIIITLGSAPAAGTQMNFELWLLFNAGNLGANTVTWNSSTPVNTVSQLTVAGNSTVTCSITINGSVSAGTLAFEVSTDNVNWFPVQGGSDWKFRRQFSVGTRNWKLHPAI